MEKGTEKHFFGGYPVSTLSVEQGIAIQTEHLAQWKTVLKDDVHAELVAWATKYNNDVDSGYNVTRGSELSNFIQNYALGHKPEKISQTASLYAKKKQA